MKKYKSVCHKIMASLCAICLLAVLIPTSHMFVAEASANNEADIVDLVSNYMHARKSVLVNGTSDKLHCFAVEGIVSDEVNHKEVLDDEGILISDSSFVITNVEEDGINTSVDLLEAISYSSHGNHANSEVAHSLRIMSDEKDNPIVVSDIYAEALSSFESCSYIAPDELAEASALALGGNSSSSCLEYMARTQIGYKEKASNSNLDSFTANAGSADYTKYGAWYGLNPAPWCAMFVSWCARQVNIPTSVIPQYSSCTAGMATFKDMNVFTYSSTYGGSYSPKVGDIFFVGTNKSASTHTGIVVARTNSTVTVVDGNWSNQVSSHTYKLTDSSLVGFAHPNYSTSSHSRVNKGTYYQCSCCGMTATSIPEIS